MNRIQMMSLLPTQSRGAELGVCAGEFSKHILEQVNPSLLYLVDVWGHISLSYDDKLMSDNEKQEIRFRYVFRNFRDDARVRMIRSMTTALPDLLPAGSLDWTYVDADHSYEGCLRDLEISDQLVHESGCILGHDYTPKFPGVIQAVTEFVAARGYYLTVVTDEKYPSFLINKTQLAHQALLEKIAAI